MYFFLVREVTKSKHYLVKSEVSRETNHYGIVTSDGYDEHIFKTKRKEVSLTLSVKYFNEHITIGGTGEAE